MNKEEFNYQLEFEKMSDRVAGMNHAAICKAILYRDYQIKQLKEYIEKITDHPSVYESEIALEGKKLL